ncbi:ABC transporter permease [Candidatus Bathyarchaeota archaeon]|nr:ABC transporter permease [Candidatus Bathyarchaeota archaeon]
MLILKELRELLRDPKILVGMVLMPVLILPLMGGAISVSQRAVERELAHASIGVWDRDGSEVSSSLVGFLRYVNQTVILISAGNVSEAVGRLMETNSSILLEIPEGYGENISRGLRGVLHVYVVLKSLGIAETGKGSVVEQVVSTYGYALSLEKIQALLQEANVTGVEPAAVYSPLSVEYSSVVRGRVVDVPPESIFGLMMSQGIMLPVTSMILLSFAMSIAATSIAVEKEEKTLETLVTLPVGRLTILAGKLAGSILVAVAGAVAYMVGFGYYMTTAFGFVPGGMMNVDLRDLGLSMGPGGLLLLGATMFVTLVSGLALALSIAVFTDSVRGAQSLVGFLNIPIMVPMIILMFTDLRMLPLPLQAVLYAIPYTHTILASKAIFMGDYFVVLRSILYITLFTLATLYIAAKIFTSERIITARPRTWKITLHRRKISASSLQRG